jgi:hypothetical protein
MQSKSPACGCHNNRSGLGINDAERAAIAMKGIDGKRLTYRRPDNAQVAQAQS